MKQSMLITMGLLGLCAVAEPASAQHYDIAPFLQDGQLLTGGYDHSGNSYAPPIRIYGYEFGEDPYDPFNPADPGINQASGLGNLPPGSALRYEILSSLLYWDGNDPCSLGAPPAGHQLILSMGASARILDAESGPQNGGFIQSVAADGSVHRHFVTSLFAGPGHSNVPGDPGYLQPAPGIYAFSLRLTLTSSTASWASDPFWIVFNNGLSEEAHDAAMQYIASAVIPEPAGLMGLILAVAALRRSRAATRPVAPDPPGRPPATSR